MAVDKVVFFWRAFELDGLQLQMSSLNILWLAPGDEVSPLV